MSVTGAKNNEKNPHFFSVSFRPGGLEVKKLKGIDLQTISAGPSAHYLVN